MSAHLRQGIATRRVFCQTSTPAHLSEHASPKHPRYHQSSRVVVGIEVIAAYDLLVFGPEIDAVSGHGTALENAKRGGFPQKKVSPVLFRSRLK